MTIVRRRTKRFTEDMGTPPGSTAIGRARITIIAVLFGAFARALLALVRDGARISIVARLGVVGEHTPNGSLTGVIGARITVFALLRTGPNTTSIGARIANRALVPIIAGFGIGNELTA